MRRTVDGQDPSPENCEARLLGRFEKDMVFFRNETDQALFIDIDSFLNEIDSEAATLLHQDEIDHWNVLKAERSARCFLAGRLAVKCLFTRCVLQTSTIPWREIKTISRNSSGKGIRPTLFFRDVPVVRDISISHSETAVLAAMTTAPEFRIGCDLVTVGSVTPALTRFFFHAEEIRLGNEFRDRCWGVKEAAYKARNDHDAFAPLQWRVSILETPDLFFCRRHTDVVTVRTFLHCNHIVAMAVVPPDRQSKPCH